MKVRLTERQIKFLLSKNILKKNQLAEMKADKAAKNILIRQGVSNPTPEEIKLKAQELETAILRGLLTKKEAYEDAHESTYNNLTDNSLTNISDFLKSFIRPINKGRANPISTLVKTTRNGEEGYDFKYTNTNGASPAERNFYAIYSNGFGLPTSEQDFAKRAFETMHATVSTNTMPMPENIGEKLELALAATFAYIDRGATYTAKFDSAPGKDITRDTDSVTFESKYTNNQKSEINDNFGASQPSLTNTEKYFCFLSSDRGYFVNSPALATIGSIGLESIPDSLGYSSDAEQENIRTNNLVFMFLQTQNDLKEEIINVLSKFREFSVVKINANVAGTSKKNVPATSENIALSRSQGNLTANQIINSALLHEPTVFNMIQKLIDSINNIPDPNKKKEIIETLAYIRFVSIFSGITPQIGEKNVMSAGTLSADDRNDFQLYLAEFYKGFCTPTGDLKNIARISGSATLMGADLRNTFANMINLLIYAWNLKDDITLARIPQQSTYTAQNAGAVGTARQGGRLGTGSNYEKMLKYKVDNGSEEVAASIICNAINNPNTPRDELKIDMLDSLESNANKLGVVVYKIQQSEPAMIAILTELLRSREGQANIYDKYLRWHSIIRDEIKKIVQETIKRVKGALDTYKKSQSQYLFDIFKKRLGRSIAKLTAQTYGDFEEYLIESRENPFWTSFDRREMWDEPNYDERLFDIFFKHEYLDDGSKNVIDDMQLSSKLLDLMLKSPDMKDLIEVLLIGIECSAIDMFEAMLKDEGIVKDPSQLQLNQLRDKFSKATLDKIYKDYYQSLDDEGRQQWIAKSEEEKIQTLYRAELIDEEQVKTLIRANAKNPAAAAQRQSSANHATIFADWSVDKTMEDPEFYEIYSESSLYRNIINDILKEARKENVNKSVRLSETHKKRLLRYIKNHKM